MPYEELQRRELYPSNDSIYAEIANVAIQAEGGEYSPDDYGSENAANSPSVTQSQYDLLDDDPIPFSRITAAFAPPALEHVKDSTDSENVQAGEDGLGYDAKASRMGQGIGDVLPGASGYSDNNWEQHDAADVQQYHRAYDGHGAAANENGTDDSALLRMASEFTTSPPENAISYHDDFRKYAYDASDQTKLELGRSYPTYANSRTDSYISISPTRSATRFVNECVEDYLAGDTIGSPDGYLADKVRAAPVYNRNTLTRLVHNNMEYRNQSNAIIQPRARHSETVASTSHIRVDNKTTNSTQLSVSPRKGRQPPEQNERNVSASNRKQHDDLIQPQERYRHYADVEATIPRLSDPDRLTVESDNVTAAVDDRRRSADSGGELSPASPRSTHGSEYEIAETRRRPTIRYLEDIERHPPADPLASSDRRPSFHHTVSSARRQSLHPLRHMDRHQSINPFGNASRRQSINPFGDTKHRESNVRFSDRDRRQSTKPFGIMENRRSIHHGDRRQSINPFHSGHHRKSSIDPLSHRDRLPIVANIDELDELSLAERRKLIRSRLSRQEIVQLEELLSHTDVAYIMKPTSLSSHTTTSVLQSLPSQSFMSKDSAHRSRDGSQRASPPAGYTTELSRPPSAHASPPAGYTTELSRPPSAFPVQNCPAENNREDISCACPCNAVVCRPPRSCGGRNVAASRRRNPTATRDEVNRQLAQCRRLFTNSSAPIWDECRGRPRAEDQPDCLLPDAAEFKDLCTRERGASRRLCESADERELDIACEYGVGIIQRRCVPVATRHVHQRRLSGENSRRCCIATSKESMATREQARCFGRCLDREVEIADECNTMNTQRRCASLTVRNAHQGLLSGWNCRQSCTGNERHACPDRCRTPEPETTDECDVRAARRRCMQSTAGDVLCRPPTGSDSRQCCSKHALTTQMNCVCEQRSSTSVASIRSTQSPTDTWAESRHTDRPMCGEHQLATPSLIRASRRKRKCRSASPSEACLSPHLAISSRRFSVSPHHLSRYVPDVYSPADGLSSLQYDRRECRPSARPSKAPGMAGRRGRRV